MRIETIATGDELLTGLISDTNSAFFQALLLEKTGLTVKRGVVVGDDRDDIIEALNAAAARCDFVLVSGGLGPTTDDVSREAVAELLGLEMIHDETVMNAIQARFARRGLEMGPRNARQAQRPHEAVVLPNHHGTAPGLYLPPLAWRGGKTPHLFLLPGPPRELQPMFTEGVLPILRKVVPPRPTVEMRMLRNAMNISNTNNNNNNMYNLYTHTYDMYCNHTYDMYSQ